MASIATGILFALSVLMLLSIVAKVDLLKGGARWHPLFVGGSWRRNHARILTGLSLFADVGFVVLVPISARAAGLAFAALVVTYTAAFLIWVPHSGNHGCGCFAFSVAEPSTRAGFVIRNMLLITVSLFVATQATHLAVGIAPVLVAVGVLTALQASVTVLDMLARRLTNVP